MVNYMTFNVEFKFDDIAKALDFLAKTGKIENTKINKNSKLKNIHEKEKERRIYNIQSLLIANGNLSLKSLHQKYRGKYGRINNRKFLHLLIEMIITNKIGFSSDLINPLENLNNEETVSMIQGVNYSPKHDCNLNEFCEAE